MPYQKKKISDRERDLFSEYIRSSQTAKQICAKHEFSRSRFNFIVRSFVGKDEYKLIEKSRKPKQTPYKLGRSLEYAVANSFRKAGYWTIRAAQSRGEADVVAIRDGEIILIQCKRGGLIDKEEWNDLFHLASRLKASAVIADRRTGRGVNLNLITNVHGTDDSFIPFVFA